MHKGTTSLRRAHGRGTAAASIHPKELVDRHFVAELTAYALPPDELGNPVTRTRHIGHRRFPKLVARMIDSFGGLVRQKRKYFGETVAFSVQAGGSLILRWPEIDAIAAHEDAVRDVGDVAADEKLALEESVYTIGNSLGLTERRDIYLSDKEASVLAVLDLKSTFPGTRRSCWRR